MQEPYLFTIILNTNRREDTLACLASLAASTYRNHTICVLDNASTDGSVAAIMAAYPQVEIIALTENLGYAGNNNVGIAAALARGADWVLVLNEDTILASDALAKLMARAQTDPAIGIVGPLVYHHDEPAVIQSAGGTLDQYLRSAHLGQNEPDAGQFNAPRDVEWISGCAICVSTAAIEQMGMLDESYFYYWEETEWCMRIHGVGWRVVVEPAARIWHKGVQRNYQPGPNVAYYNTRNRLLTLRKQQARTAAWAVAYAEIARTLASMTLRPRWREKRQARDAIWQGLRDYHRGSLGQRRAG